MNKRSELGKLGEDIACRYLVENNFQIIERNFREPWGEIDIVAKDKDKTLVFVEVKTVSQLTQATQDIDSQISAEDQLTQSKLQKLQKTASLYVGHYPELVNDDFGWQIDLVAITLIKGINFELTEEISEELAELLTTNGKKYVIKHYKNI
ncbi:MAG: YraN family protein [Patescibacteria group bacterium]